MKKNDLILIIAIICIAGAMYGFWQYSNMNKTDYTITIYLENEVYYTNKLTKNLKESFEIKTDYGNNYVTIENGIVDITEADCPDQICADSKSISLPGESLVCLPHQVYIEITGEKEADDVDVTSY